MDQGAAKVIQDCRWQNAGPSSRSYRSAAKANLHQHREGFRHILPFPSGAELQAMLALAVRLISRKEVLASRSMLHSAVFGSGVLGIGAPFVRGRTVIARLDRKGHETW